jgi:hypothetical protein
VLWFPGKGTRNMTPQVPGLFYSTKLHSVLSGLVETTDQLCLQESAPLDRSWSQSGVQKGSSLCAETFGAKICRPTGCRFAIKDLLEGRRIGTYQDLKSGGEQVLSRSRVHTPPTRTSSASYTPSVVSTSQRSIVKRPTRIFAYSGLWSGPRLHAQFGCGKCIFSCPHPPQASQVLLQPPDTAPLCQQQVHRASARRLFRLHQTRPRTFGDLGSNTTSPAPPISPSRRVLTCVPAARLGEHEGHREFVRIGVQVVSQTCRSITDS